MNEQLAWAEALQIPQQEIQKWLAQCPPGQSVLVWALESGFLAEDLYLRWAQNAFSLMKIKNSFFQKSPPLDLWLRMNNYWPENTLPLTEWDGVVYMGCLEPVPDFQAPIPIQWVLAPWSELKKWMHVQKESVVKNIEPKAIQELSFTSLLNPTSAPSNEVSQTSAEVPVRIPPEIPAPPAGDSGSDSTVVNDFSENTNTKFYQVAATSEGDPLISEKQSGIMNSPPPPPRGLPPPPPPTFKPISSAAMGETTVASSQENELTLSGLTVSHNVDSELTVSHSAPMSAAEGNVTLTQQATTTSLQTDSSISQSISSSTQDSYSDFGERTMTYTQAQVDGIVNVSRGKVISDSLQVKSIDDIPKYSLYKMRKHFDKTMILVFGGDKVIPWKWDEAWGHFSSDVGQLELNLPSMFKFVSDTKVPYHGYTVHSPTNDQFYIEWCAGAKPEHVTLCPITAMGVLTGMILGICSRASGQKIPLAEVELIASETSDLFIKMTMAESA